ncbi:MAG: pyridoxamine 5'-phosphate oxidase family protein, partial [SAR86 cluster bacterium]|nr:pyridoxamine 5'-phosphate oxidase family protein [SAR86 cluster bacterium]
MTTMTETEKQEFLADLHVGILSLNDNSKGPLTVPIWYDYEPGGELWFITGPDSLKGKLLEVGVRLSLVAQSEEPPYKYVSVEGPVVSIDESTEDDLLAMA